MAQNKDIEKLADIIKDIKIAMLVTQEGEILRSRPMATNKIQEDGIIWFFTEKSSSKSQEVNQTSSVNISYADTDKELYVSVSGKASLIDDRQKIDELWTPVLKAWFPNGKEDPNIALLKIEISQAEYWDAPGNKVIQLVGMLKAAATGKPYEAGTHKKITV